MEEIKDDETLTNGDLLFDPESENEESQMETFDPWNNFLITNEKFASNLLIWNNEEISSLNYSTNKSGETVNHFVEREIYKYYDENQVCGKKKRKKEETNCYLTMLSKIKLPTGWMAPNIWFSEIITLIIKLSSLSDDKSDKFIERQILLQKKDVSVQILGRPKEVNLAFPETLEELEKVIEIIDRAKLCEGGPKKDAFNDITVGPAYIDMTNTWRHFDCELIIDLGKSCKYCIELINIFKNYSKCNLKKITYKQV